MSKICPNCLRPVRSGAYYCGYCGTSLVPTPSEPAPTVKATSKGGTRVAAPIKAKRAPKSGNAGRSWIKVPITLLILVILAALAIRFWPEILTLLNQALPILNLS